MQCNRDCLNCLYPDCVVDELLPEDLNEIAQRDREIRHDNKDNKHKKIAKCQRKYREEHKEEIAEYKRKYYAEHKERKIKSPQVLAHKTGKKVYNIKST